MLLAQTVALSCEALGICYMNGRRVVRVSISLQVRDHAMLGYPRRALPSVTARRPTFMKNVMSE